ncbi:MAG TPA: NAD-dependent epimerase/dehydratase family protein [Mycobacteriales bacterium]
MRVFVTGASGYIGSAVVPALITAGHEVAGLARSDDSAAKVTAMGAAVTRGSIGDLDVLAAAAADADATVHLAFDHETMMAGDFAGAVSKDLAVARAIGDALVGTGKAFFGIGLGSATTQNPRGEVANAINGYAAQGVRAVLVAVANSTHSDRDKHGFLPRLIEIARETGVSGYLGDGTNHWAAGHVDDLAQLYVLALEKAPAGAQLVAAGEPPVEVRAIAESIGRHLGLPARSVDPSHFAAFPFAGMNVLVSNESTRELLGWTPTGPTLLEDLDQGHYFT